MREQEKDTAQLRELSNHTVHNASIYQDQDSIAIAVVIYSLSKIIERGYDKISPKVYDRLVEARSYLKQDNLDKYRNIIKNIFSELSKADERLQMFIGDVVGQARIKKGMKLFEHGLSIARASELLGISQWDLQSYLGQTKIVEIYHDESKVKARLDFARGLFQ